LLSYLPLMRATMCRPHPYALPASVAAGTSISRHRQA
jgi:hypothetical protein